jgi:predicted ATPase
LIFLFTEIDHPAVLQGWGTPEADQVLAGQHYLLEEILSVHGARWTERTPAGVMAILSAEEAAQAALDIQKQFTGRTWDQFGPGKVRVVLHSGEAEQFGQTYVGPDINHAQKLLETAWGGQVLLTVPAVHFIPLPPGGRLHDLGPHFLKDLSEPENVFSLLRPDLPNGDCPPLRSLRNYAQNFFPQLTPFFGRKEEVAELAEWLAHSPARLVTLAGPGGFGKTRLAFQTAAEVVDRFKDGAWWVSLAPVLTDNLLVSAIASALKFFFFGAEDPKVQLLNYLKTKECLIVLDNFEHLMEGADLVTGILRSAPGVKLMVTSRETLGTGEERVFEVRGLRYPEEGQEGPLEAFPAVQLFLKSARRVRPDYALKEEDGPPLLRLCRLLEGMPLGLELSAAWVSTRTLGEIANRIESSQEYLASTMPHLPPRHRSLRSVFEYSWILLSESQKKALLGVAVFRGGFTLPSARKVAGATESILNALEAKSLVRKRSDGRYEIHELLKHYAKERVYDDPALMEKMLDAHCRYFGSLLKGREKDLFGPRQRQVFEDLLLEMENLREGWNRAVERLAEKEMADYLDSLFTLYETKGWFQEGRAVFQKAADALRLKYPEPSRMPDDSAVLMGKLLSRRADFELDLGEPKIAIKLFEESLELFQEASAQKQSGFALCGLGLAAETLGEFKKARENYDKSYRAYMRSGQRTGITLALNHLGHMLVRLGNTPKGLSLIRKSLSYSKKDQDEREMAYSYILTGEALYDMGQYDESRLCYVKSLDAYSRSGDRRGVAWALRNLGRVAGLSGDFAGARQMYKESLLISKELCDRRTEAASTTHLGYAHWSLGDYEEAGRCYREGLALFREVGDRRGEAWSLELLGNLMLAQGEDREAEDHYRQAHYLISREGFDNSSQAWHFYHLGDLIFFRGDWKAADVLFQGSLDNFKKTGDIHGQTLVFTRKGDIACRLNALPEARKYFLQAARRALESKLTPMLADLVVGLARLLKAQGDNRQALGFLLAALSHPTCRRETKDGTASFLEALRPGFTSEDWEGAQQWAKTVRLEDLVAAWAAPAPSSPRRTKSRTHPRKSKAKKRK